MSAITWRGVAPALGGDALGGGARVGRRDDWPADDEIAGAGREGFGRASSSGSDRRWPRRAADAGRDDRERAPQRRRMSAISCGDATTPSSPAPAPARQALDLVGDRAADADLGERRLVEARQHRHGDDERRRDVERRAASSSAASRAARIMSQSAGGVHVHHPDAEPRRGARPRPATVFGMSWNFRSRKTRSPRATSSSTNAGPVAREQPAADLESADRAAQRDRRARAPRRRCRRRARLGADPFASSRARRRVERCRRGRRCGRSGGAACSRAMPSSSFGQMSGSTKLAVPTCTAVRAGDHELERVARVGDAAHADDRDLHRLPALVHHADGDRPDRRAAQAADARSRSSAAASRRRSPWPGTC